MLELYTKRKIKAHVLYNQVKLDIQGTLTL